MTEFRKYKPRELMQGLLEGKVYQYDNVIFGVQRTNYYKMKGDFIYMANFDHNNRKAKFLKQTHTLSTIDWLGDRMIKEVSEKESKKEIAKRNKGLKSEKGC